MHGNPARVPGAWRTWWRHGVGTGLVAVLVVLDVPFLLQRSETAAAVFLVLQVGLVLVAVPYLVALATVAGARSAATTSALVREALWFAFGSARRGTALLGTVVTVAVFSLLLPAGPLLLTTTLPLLVSAVLLDQSAPATTGETVPI